MNDLDYEYSVPITAGGPTGTYDVKSPFPQYSEVAVFGVMVSDTGYVFVSPEPFPETISNASNLGNGIRGAAYNAVANTNIPTDTVFWLLNADQVVHFSVSVQNSHVALVTFLFRRPRVSPQPFQPYEVTPELEQTYNQFYEKAVLEQQKRGRN